GGRGDCGSRDAQHPHPAARRVHRRPAVRLRAPRHAFRSPSLLRHGEGLMIAFSRLPLGLGALAGGAVLALVFAGAARADCTPLQRAFDAALASGDLDAVAQQARAIDAETDCAGSVRLAAKRAAADAFLRASEREQSPARRLEVLTTGASLAQ